MTAAAVVSALLALAGVLPAAWASRSIIPASGSNTCNAAPWRVYRPSNEVRRPDVSSYVVPCAPARSSIVAASTSIAGLHTMCVCATV